MDRYIILSVDYCDDYGQSLKWIAPEIADEPLQLTEDDESEYKDMGATWHKKWAGIISGESWERLANAWDLTEDRSEPNMGMITEYGHLESLCFMFDGMDWNMGGQTPIFDASLSVSIPKEES